MTAVGDARKRQNEAHAAPRIAASTEVAPESTEDANGPQIGAQGVEAIRRDAQLWRDNRVMSRIHIGGMDAADLILTLLAALDEARAEVGIQTFRATTATERRDAMAKKARDWRMASAQEYARAEALTAERDSLLAVVASVRRLINGRHPMPYCAADGRAFVDLLAQVRALLPKDESS